MPVTAKLSRKFYETFGDDIANELVEWFNQVDTTYRGDLRELNELNFARFDAKMEQRLAQSEARMEQRLAQSEVRMEQRFAQVEAKMEQRLGQLETRLVTMIQESKADLMKWMFGSIFAAWITLLGVIITLAKLH